MVSVVRKPVVLVCMVSVVRKPVWFWCAWLALCVNLCGFGVHG